MASLFIVIFYLDLGYLVSSLLISIKEFSYLYYCRLGCFFAFYVLLLMSFISIGILLFRLLDRILTATFIYNLISLGVIACSGSTVWVQVSIMAVFNRQPFNFLKI